jgi:uridylate kinase
VKSSPLNYKRIVLKISGEAIGGGVEAFDLAAVGRICSEIRRVCELGCEMGIVIGGGNIVRGGTLSTHGLDRIQSDSMGMLATIMNGLLFETMLRNMGVDAVVQSALEVRTLTEPVVLQRTKQYLAEGRVIIFTGGTGSPYFTTDTAAALRACEIGADALLKATKVDGVYDKDPVLHKDAKFHAALTYREVLYRDLKVMDMAAVAMCQDHRIPIMLVLQ